MRVGQLPGITPGVGKTMLAIGLARLAVEAGHRVYFTTAEELAARCTKAAREGRWATAMRFYAGPRLLVIDEFGYRRLSEDGNAALFQVISQRYLKSSVALTSHVGIASWAERLGDPMMAAAMWDRLPDRRAQLPDALTPGSGRDPAPGGGAMTAATNPSRPQRPCTTCGRSFAVPANNPGKRYCTPRCRVADWHHRHDRADGRRPGTAGCSSACPGCSPARQRTGRRWCTGVAVATGWSPRSWRHRPAQRLGPSLV